MSNNLSCISVDSQRAEKPIKCVGVSAVSSKPLHGIDDSYTASDRVQEPQDGGNSVLTVTTFSKIREGDSVS